MGSWFYQWEETTKNKNVDPKEDITCGNSRGFSPPATHVAGEFIGCFDGRTKHNIIQHLHTTHRDPIALTNRFEHFFDVKTLEHSVVAGLWWKKIIPTDQI